MGFWWKGDLLATRSIDENIKKARRAFFHYGSIGAFQGDLSPLSSRSILDSCVMSVLMYGCENWLMTHVLVEKVVIPSRTGQESPEMAKASQQHCGPYGYWTAVDEEQDIGEEVGIFAGGVGWQLKMCEW